VSDKTGIEWTDATWNPVTGCTEVSPGCDHCYAKTFAERWRGTPGHHFENGFDVTLRPSMLELPLRWRKPRRIFVNSMSDLFHKDVPDEYIARVFAVMALAPQHTFQVLTKRHARMRSLVCRRI
jgi:protein gp37